MEVRTPGFCALCKSRCGSIMVTENNKFIGHEPNPQHPTGQALCVKGRSAAEMIYRESRQLYPLRRTKPKGEQDPGWEPISWDDALNEIAAKLNKLKGQHGAESVAFGWTTPSGTAFSDDARWVERFTNAFATANIAYGTEICNWHKDHAHTYTFGRSIASPDFIHSGCVVLWGHNPTATWLNHASKTGDAIGRGAKLIVVDPRKAGYASKADQWLRVRPGSDGALALGIANIILTNKWFDDHFLRRWSNGPLLVRSDNGRFLRAAETNTLAACSTPEMLCALNENNELVSYSPDSQTFNMQGLPGLYGDVEIALHDGALLRCRTAFSLYAELCAKYVPQRVEKLCWVNAVQITETARLLTSSGPVSYYAWSGVGQHTNATQTDRAIAILMGLTGSFDAPGGNVTFGTPPGRDVSAADLVSPQQRAKCVELTHSALGPGADRWITSHSMYKAILEHSPYAIRGLFNFGRNFIVNHADGVRGAEALSQLEFMVHADLVLNPTANFADIFLPVNTPWERESLRIGFEGSEAAESLIQLRQAAIPPLGQARSDGQIVFDLATRMGMADLFWQGDINAGLEYILEPTGITLDMLRKQPAGISYPTVTHYRQYEKKGFNTATRLMEIYSEVFLLERHAPLPEFLEPAQSPFNETALHLAFPLVLTSAKVVQFTHGQQRDIASLRQRAEQPEITLHPETAMARGIAEKEIVEVKTKHGTVRMRARFDASLHPGVVWAQYGWWQENKLLGLPAYPPLSDRGANFNKIIENDELDPISGSVGLRSSMCEIVSVNGQTNKAWVGWRSFRIAKIVAESADVLSFYLQPEDGKPLNTFKPGQHVTVQLIKAESGESFIRCYTLSSGSNEDYYRISVKFKAENAGNDKSVSAAMHNIDAGHQLLLQAPSGNFHMENTAPDAHLLFVAGGIGITPILAMLHSLAENKPQSKATLFYGVRRGAEHAFAKEILHLTRALPGLDVLTFFSAPDATDKQGAHYHYHRRITVQDIKTHMTKTSEVLMCGPGSMINMLMSGLTNSAFPADRIHTETFGPSSAVADIGAEAKPQRVIFSRSGGECIWQPGKGSLLDQLDAHGKVAASGCRAGQCESCMLTLSKGKVLHPEGSAVVEKNRCLPCVCVPLTTIELDI